MTKPNRLSFVVPAGLAWLSVLSPASGQAQGWPQQMAMWQSPQWSERGPVLPDGPWNSRSETAPAETIPGESRPPDGARAQRGSKSAPAKLAPAGQRAARGKAFRHRGIASWYGKRFHGRKTASGQRFDMHSMTAAHRTLPIPSYVRVSNPANGASVVVLVNDRGPFARNRIIDLSYAAASALGITKRGTATVELEPLPNTRPNLAAAPRPDEVMPVAAPTAID